MAEQIIDFQLGTIAWEQARKHMQAVDSLMSTMIDAGQRDIDPDDVANISRLAMEEMDRAHERFDELERLLFQCRQVLAPEQSGSD